MSLAQNLQKNCMEGRSKYWSQLLVRNVLQATHIGEIVCLLFESCCVRDWIVGLSGGKTNDASG